jgi:hypothetical protein
MTDLPTDFDHRLILVVSLDRNFTEFGLTITRGVLRVAFKPVPVAVAHDAHCPAASANRFAVKNIRSGTKSGWLARRAET